MMTTKSLTILLVGIVIIGAITYIVFFSDWVVNSNTQPTQSIISNVKEITENKQKNDAVPIVKYNEEEYYNNAIWIKFSDFDSFERHIKWLSSSDNVALYYRPALVLDKDYALSSVKAANLNDNVQVSEIFMDLLKREDIKVVRFYSSVRALSDKTLLPNDKILALYFLPKNEEEMNLLRFQLEEVPFIESVSFIPSKPVPF